MLHYARLQAFCYEQSPPIALLVRWLEREEWQKLKSFRQQVDQWRFLLGRALLRQGLLNKFGVDRAPLEITASGKPVLALGALAGLDFSITHDGDWVAVAFATGRRVGIDLAELRSFESWQEIAPDYMHPDEYRQLIGLPTCEQAHAACRIWTAKEAILKASGHGLSIDPREISLELGHQLAVRIVSTGISPSACYRIQELANLNDACLAAVLLAPSDATVEPQACLPSTAATEVSIMDLLYCG